MGLTVAEPFDALDRLSPEALDAWWTRRIRKILAMASAELPFYRSRFAAAGFDAAEFRALGDLARIPVFDKDVALAAQRACRSHDFGNVRAPGGGPTTLSLSSGTSGTTFITHTARWRRLQGYSSSRAHWWAGLRPGSPFVLSAPAWHGYAAIQPVIARRFGMSCIVVSGTFLPRFADRIADAIRRFRPRFVSMFLPMVFSILGRSGADAFAGVETLLVTGAPITPGMRARLGELTGIRRVTEVAGTSENLLAMECREANGLHVVPDTCYLEVLEPGTGRPVAHAERGSIVHTYLIPEGSIFLRYDSGDVGTIDRIPCPCGLPSPRIRMLGRRENGFRLAGEDLLPCDVQRAIEESVPELAGAPFVIVREALAEGRLRLLLSSAEAPPVLLEAARQALRRRFAVAVETDAARELPIRFKGVAPILSEHEVE